MHRMYTVSKAPMKFVTKSRRGLTNNIDRMDTLRDNKMKMELNNNNEELELPKPVFSSISRKHHTHSNHLKKWHQDVTISPEHEELIRFISESWSSVFKECESSSAASSSSSEDSSSDCQTSRIVYYEDESSPSPLDDFVPFDLEAWWGRRLFNTITKSIP
uniref:Protein FAM195A n=1 Tax=Cacopsylla melanoneura TaxID=428564 RepID=A0A8D8ZWQ5_9HEMI